MSKYYEQTKSNYSRDIDHLVTFNKNGLWIKENLLNKQRIIAAAKPEGFNILDVTIFHSDTNRILSKIIAEKADIKNNRWKLSNVTVYKPIDQIIRGKKFESYEIESIYNFEK